VSALIDAVVMTTVSGAHCYDSGVLPLSSDALRLRPSTTTTSSRPTLP